MMRLLFAAVWIACCVAFAHGQKEKASKFLKKFNAEALVQHQKVYDAGWAYFTDQTKENQQKYAKGNSAYAKWMSSQQQKAKNISREGLDPSEARQLKLLSLSPPNSKDEAKNDEKHQVMSEIKQIHGSGTFPINPKFIKTLNTTKLLSENITEMGARPYGNEIMATSTDPMELLYVWEQNRKATGDKMAKKYAKMVQMQNEAAEEDGYYKDMGDYARRGQYEVDNLAEVAEQLWKELEPLYKEVHAYIRFRLTEIYPDLVKDGELIPAHLSGDMSGAGWGAVFDRIKPYSKTCT